MKASFQNFSSKQKRLNSQQNHQTAGQSPAVFSWEKEMTEAMKQEIEAAEQKSILDITDKMLAVCNNRKLDHCVAAALSVIGNVIGQEPKLMAAAAESLHKLADHIAASAETKH